ncbi:MAG: hypothetical protein AAFN93_21175 [Bacteroidota bacterium]
MSAEKGIICSLTNEQADFEDNCAFFEPIETSVEDYRKDSGRRFINDDRGIRELDMIRPIDWRKYSSFELLPNSITIRESRFSSISLIILLTSLVVGAFTNYEEEFANPIFGFVVMGVVIIFLFSQIYQLATGKYFYIISNSGITTAENKTLKWKDIAFVVLARYSKTRSIIIKMTDNSQVELKMPGANYSSQKIGHLLYLYQSRFDKTGEGVSTRRKI